MNLDLYRKRLNAHGTTAVDRLVNRNLEEFRKALAGSYNSEEVIMDGESHRAIMVDYKLSMETDQKIFSMLHESNLRMGSIIHVLSQDSRWIAVQEDLNNRAYSRFVCKRATTEVSWRNLEDEICTSWASVTGPTETTIKSESKSGVLFDRLSGKISLWLPQNDDTDHLKKYDFLMVEKTVWQVASIDKITFPGVLEIALEEAEGNNFLDNMEDNIARDSNFKFACLFDKDITFESNTPVSVNVELFKDGKDITEQKDSLFEIKTDVPYNYDEVHGMITFLGTGSHDISIGYPKLGIEKTYTIDIEESMLIQDEYYSIEGNSSVIPYVNEQNHYDIERYLNGVDSEIPQTGEWRFDKSFVKNIISENRFGIDIKFDTNRTGRFLLEYLVDGEVVVSKQITVHTMFG